MTSGASPNPEPIYAWQVLDDEGRWGTISCHLAKGDNLVLQTRYKELALGPMKQLAETARAFGKPVYRYIPDGEVERL